SIVARLSSTRFDINDVNPPAKGGSKGSTSGGATGGATSTASSDGRLIPNDPLPLDVMKSVNADIEYNAATFVAAVAELTDFEIKIVLKDGKLDISPFKAGVGEGSVDGAISMDGSQANPPVSVSIKGQKMGLESLLAGAGMRDKIVGPLDVNIDLKGAGSSPRAIAGSMTGNTLVSLYDSRVLKKAFEDAMGDTLAGLLASENGWIVIDCAVLDYDLKDGLMETKAGYTASGPITVITEGTINLKTEELDLNAKPAGGGLTSLPLVIRGTFANPSIIPDPQAIGLGIVTGLLTGGIAPALLAVVGDLPAGHPCKKEVEESKEQVENAPAQQNAPADVLKDPGKAIEEGVGGALKGLFGN
ncbi:MAG: AsmA family protein, partial [Alphaproteobacteria bacterium]|nr:AsmA family protein [Alphaproteobacteria bacterium]